MEPDDLLCSRNARPEKALARADGMSRRASGWAGDNVAHSERSIRPRSWRVIIFGAAASGELNTDRLKSSGQACIEFQDLIIGHVRRI